MTTRISPLAAFTPSACEARTPQPPCTLAETITIERLVHALCWCLTFFF